MPTKGELNHYYSSNDYRTEHGPVPIDITKPGMPTRTVQPDAPDYGDALDMMAAWRVDWATKHVAVCAGLRVLEVGSGDGRTLAAWAALGCTVTGVEPDRICAAESAKLLPEGAKIHAGTIDEVFSNLDEEYDVVVMHHVLEHFHEPLEVLKHLRAVMTPSAALVIEVPNVFSPGLPLTEHWQHVHLVDFSAETLQAMLVRAKFRPHWVADNGALRCVARPTEEDISHTMSHSGEFVAGFLHGVESLCNSIGLAK